MSDLFTKLNPAQIEAVKTLNGPVLIIAGAGSGKTRALTYRIAYLIQQGVNPWNILAVTFTNKAANEMKERLIDLLGIKNPNPYSSELPTVGTFHSVCVRILRKNIHLLDMENNFVIYDEADQLALVRQIMQQKDINESKFNPRAILSHISGAKNELVDAEHYSRFVHNYFTEKVAEVYKPYQLALEKNQALDFDDLLMKTVKLFNQEPAVLDKYQEQFKFISIDEYQDTNHSQYTLVNLLAQKYRNLCVIGDGDQSIYSWRGANMQNILDFEKDYPDAKIIKLEQNYRSTQTILDGAHQIIVKNKHRKEKKLWTERADGEKIKIVTADDERDEGEIIIEELKKQTQNQETKIYSDFTILYRTNAQSRVLEEVFMRNAIPYKIVGGVKFYQRKEIKDMLSYLRIVQNPNDNVSLLRVINSPPRKIGSKTLSVVNSFASRFNLSLFEVLEKIDQIAELPDNKKERLTKFLKTWKNFIKSNKTFPASGVIKTVLHLSGYQEALLADGTPEGETRFENIQELISVAAKYDKLEPGISLSTFLEEVSLISDLDAIDEKDNAVTMMTLHSAKGLEFPVVFIVGLEEGVFPHSRSLLEPQELEEERRLMYVGMTRAKDILYLLHAKQRLLYGEQRMNAPSRFLDDLPEELIEFNLGEREKGGLEPENIGKKLIPFEEIEFDKNVDYKDGDKVLHPNFGEGIVVSVLGGIAIVAFKNSKHGIKKLALNIAPLMKI